MKNSKKLLTWACILSTFIFIGSSIVMPTNAANKKKEVVLEQDVKFVTIKYLKGTAYAYNLDGEQRVLKRDDRMFFGEILRTTNKSLAIVAVIDGVKLKVESNSVVEVDNLYSKAERRKKPQKKFFPSLFLHRGSLFGDVDKDRKDQRKVRVKSKYVALGVRGTQFFVNIDPKNEGQYTAHVKRGVVQLSSGKQKQIVDNGNGAHLASDGTLGKAEEMQWSEELNYNFDPLKGSLETSQKVFAKIEQSYKEYSARITKKANSYFDSQKRKFKKMKPKSKSK